MQFPWKFHKSDFFLRRKLCIPWFDETAKVSLLNNLAINFRMR